MKRITEMFAFVATDKDGTEGVVAAELNGIWHPLVGADMERVNSLRPMAQRVSRDTGTPVRLLKFSRREDLGQA